jgi:hypothetical protein
LRLLHVSEVVHELRTKDLVLGQSHSLHEGGVDCKAEGSGLLLLPFDLLLPLEEELVLLVNEFLLALDVLEHVLVLREHHVVGKHLGVLFIELVDSWKSLNGFLVAVVALEVL